MVFFSSMIMAYTAGSRPFWLPIHSDLEIINETLVLLNSYFLMIYSDFIPDLKTRYTMGWQNIWIISLLVGINLVTISYL